MSIIEPLIEDDSMLARFLCNSSSFIITNSDNKKSNFFEDCASNDYRSFDGEILYKGN